MGRNRVADLYGPGDLVGFAALCGPRPETVVALEEAALVPLGPRYALADERLDRYILRNLAERCGHKTGRSRVRAPLDLTHDALADMAQSSRVTLTRIMGELRKEGAVFSTCGDHEVDPASLRAAEHNVLQIL